MTIVLLTLILVALVIVGVGVWMIARQMTDTSSDQLGRLGDEVEYADRRMAQITAQGIQAMIDEALHELRSRE